MLPAQPTNDTPPPGGVSPFDAVIDVMRLAYTMNYHQSEVARRLGVARVALYQYWHRRHVPRQPVRILARQLYDVLMEGLKGPLKATPTMHSRAATSMINKYLDSHDGMVKPWH